MPSSCDRLCAEMVTREQACPGTLRFLEEQEAVMLDPGREEFPEECRERCETPDAIYRDYLRLALQRETCREEFDMP